MKNLFFIVLITWVAFFGCKENQVSKGYQYRWVEEEVTVSAYNSVGWQTDGDPNITAWGDTLKPGMKAIAISRDLLKAGLKHNTRVRIETLTDTFLVKDKMHQRWKKRVDLYMGTNVKKAQAWGKKKLKIYYAVPIIE